MGEQADRDDHFLGDAAQIELVEEPALDVARQQPVERQDRGEQRRDPDHPAAGTRQQLGRRADREREQHRHRDEEQYRQQGRAASSAAAHLGEVAAEQGEDHAHVA